MRRNVDRELLEKSRYTQVSRAQFLDIVLRRVKARDDDSDDDDESDDDQMRDDTEIAKREIQGIRNEGDKIFTRIWTQNELKSMFFYFSFVTTIVAPFFCHFQTYYLVSIYEQSSNIHRYHHSKVSFILNMEYSLLDEHFGHFYLMRLLDDNLFDVDYMIKLIDIFLVLHKFIYSNSHANTRVQKNYLQRLFRF